MTTDKDKRIMIGLVSKTHRGFYVISPMRRASPIRYATLNEDTVSFCKKVEKIFVILVAVIGFNIYLMYDGLESLIRLLIVFLIFQPLAYVFMFFPNKDLKKYDASIHGKMID